MACLNAAKTKLTQFSACPEEIIYSSLTNCKGVNKTVKLFDLKLVLNFCISTTKKLCSNTELFQRCYLWRGREGTQSDTKLAFFCCIRLIWGRNQYIVLLSLQSWRGEVGVALRTFRRSVYSAYWCVHDRKVKTPNSKHIDERLLNRRVYLNHWLRNYNNASVNLNWSWDLTTRVVLQNDHFPSKINKSVSKYLSPVIYD